MAGKYSRFKLFGAKVPKYLLPLGDGTILSKIIESTKKNDENANFYFIANRDDQLFYPIIKSIFNAYDISNSRLLYIDDTSSQLETALYTEDLLPKSSMDQPLCFVNIDTLTFSRNDFFHKLKHCSENDSLIDTFKGNSSKYSYAFLNKDGNVSEIVDNNIVSKYACSGLYGFGSFLKMKTFTKILLKQTGTSNFTDLYNYYLQKSLTVEYTYSPNKNDTIVLGTPEEYIINIHKFVK